MTAENWTARKAYKDSTADLNNTLKLFGFPKSDCTAQWVDTPSCVEIRDSLKRIYDRQKIEEMNEYRKAIIALLSWVGSGYNLAFVERLAGHKPNVLFVMRKALEVVHVLLARDLRRKNLTLNEKQMFGDVNQLISKIDDPRVFVMPVKSPA